jgi:predicted nuclease of predicted toxin-antitoxin system
VAGYEVIHTLDLPLGNHTPDSAINELSLAENWIVITKDTDFVISFRVKRQPFKLLLVSTGNIRNSDLEVLFARNLQSIVEAFDQNSFVEIDRSSFIIHE